MAGDRAGGEGTQIEPAEPDSSSDLAVKKHPRTLHPAGRSMQGMFHLETTRPQPAGSRPGFNQVQSTHWQDLPG